MFGVYVADGFGRSLTRPRQFFSKLLFAGNVGSSSSEKNPSKLPPPPSTMNVIVPKPQYTGEVWEGNAKFAEELETVRMPADKKTPAMLKYGKWFSIKSKPGNVPARDGIDTREMAVECEEYVREDAARHNR